MLLSPTLLPLFDSSIREFHYFRSIGLSILEQCRSRDCTNSWALLPPNINNDLDFGLQDLSIEPIPLPRALEHAVEITFS
ncbi:hypothetical protein V6N13_125910 [Hibiscus sabdariffa]|uniref:Uncharacterized protein n=2 Tax=Hibiscus sabdariffa TaxID=183260 RepID=A0ABR2AE68_9ROSI